MRTSRTLAVYLSREILTYTALGLVVMLTIFVSQNVLKQLDDMLAIGFSFADFVVAVRCLVPTLLAYAVPVAFLFGALLAVVRLSADREIIAMRACGQGMSTLVIPTVLLGAIVSAISAYLIAVLEHESRREMMGLFNTVAARGGFIEPGAFRSVGRRVIFVEGRDSLDRLEGIVISDRTNKKRPLMIFAERGEMSFDVDRGSVKIRLRNGDVHIEPGRREPARYQRVAFQNLDYDIPVSRLMSVASRPDRPKYMTRSELLAVLERAHDGDSLGDLSQKNPVAYQLEIHRRLALPLAPLIFALLAVPLGLSPARRSRAFALLLCAVIVFLYYVMGIFGQRLAVDGHIHAAVAQWAPNLALFALSLALIRRARSRSES